MALILQAQAERSSRPSPGIKETMRLRTAHPVPSHQEGIVSYRTPPPQPHTILVFRLVETIGVSGGVCAMLRSLSTLFPAEDDVFDSREGGSRADQQAHP